MTTQAFNAIFQIQDRATATLANIAQRASQLHSAALRAAGATSSIGDAIQQTAAASRDMQIAGVASSFNSLNLSALALQPSLQELATIATEDVNEWNQELEGMVAVDEESAIAMQNMTRFAQSLANQLGKMAETGQVTSSKLRNLAQSFMFLSHAQPEFQDWQAIGDSLESMAVRYAQVEDQARVTGNTISAQIQKQMQSQLDAEQAANRLILKFQGLSSSGNLTAASLDSIIKQMYVIAQSAAPQVEAALLAQARTWEVLRNQLQASEATAKSQAAAEEAANRLILRFNGLSQAGMITSATLNSLIRQMYIIAQSASPAVQTSLMAQVQAWEQLRDQTKAAEVTMTESGRRGLQFMGDVSNDTARKMHLLSAASQGVILGMSAVQGSVLNAAFSMIFLQFSGALKLSLGMAALTAVTTLAVKQFQNFFTMRREMQALANSFAIVTGAVSSFALATSVAEGIVKALRLTSDAARDLEDGLVKAQAALRNINIEPTRTHLEIFAGAFLQARASGVESSLAVKGAFDTLKTFIETGVIVVRSELGETTVSYEEFQRRSVEALTRLSGAQGETIISVGDVRKAFQEAATEIPLSVQDILKSAKGGYVDLVDVVTAISRDFSLSSETVMQLTDNMFTRVEDRASGLRIIWEDAFKGISEATAREVGIESRARRAIMGFIEELKRSVDYAERLESTLQRIGPRAEGPGYIPPPSPSPPPMPVQPPELEHLLPPAPRDTVVIMGDRFRAVPQVNVNITGNNMLGTPEDLALEIAGVITDTVRRVTGVGVFPLR